MSDRCEKRRDGRVCGYALIGAACPICDGRQVSERLPMLAPMPRPAEVARRHSRVYAFPVRRGAA